MRPINLCWLFAFTMMFMPIAWSEEPVLVGHWPLRENGREITADLATTSRGVEFSSTDKPGATARPAARGRFNGRDSVVEVADAQSLRLGTEEFSISLWLNTESELDDALGDLVSQYNPATRTGFHLGLYSHGGVTNGQPNSRQLHFGIDQGRIEAQFTDHGRPGTAVFIFSLCVHNGDLYAATCHAGKGEAGHVFRYAGRAGWVDLGSPDKANSISALAVHDGALYAASSKYRLAGSALAESENPHSGGKVFRLGESDTWVSCGTLSAETEGVGSLVVFRGKLYAGSLYRPAGFFRYEGGEKWTSCPTPDGKRVEAMTVFNGAIFATSYDEGSVFRFDGKNWEAAGKIPGATQTYGFAIHAGNLYVSEWPQAHVYRYAGGTNWVDAGRLGQELEAMPLLVYNGKMYGGTLPSAEVYRYDGDMNWAKIGQVDATPDVKYRRAWSMAVFQGRLFAGTLPAGRVVSIEAGRNATGDRELKPGWHHVAAVRGRDRLRLFVDGEQVAESSQFAAKDYDLTNRQPLRIGFGAQDHFHGDLADVRLYRGALSAEQVGKLHKGIETIPGKKGGYHLREIEGWSVHISDTLLADEKDTTEAALALLKDQLAEIVRKVPAKALAKLREVPLWFSPEYPTVVPRAEYHPGADWLRANGRNPEMVRAVEFTNVRIFERETRRMPNFALHELAHAFHDRVLGFDHPELEAALKRAKTDKLYDAVERWNGPDRPTTKEKAYGMTNSMEYFAETTEALFSRNDFFPFTAAELEKHDPEMFKLLTRLWSLD